MNTPHPPNRTALRIYQISQIGMEMTVPVGLGVALDYWLGTMPICTVIGAILGPTLGFIHLLGILHQPADDSKP
ncbi:MAG TPA: AtpZ/AtpI family protein [Gemmatales bacterium]|nr:AtpZ/AtpI family protein [Gemmatales bacterium]